MSFITNTHIEVKNQFKKYLLCTSQEQLILRVLALFYGRISQTLLKKILVGVANNSSVGLPELAKSFTPGFRDHIERLNLISVTHQGVEISRYLCHALSMQCVNDGSIDDIVNEINLVKPVIETGYWGRDQYVNTPRTIHNCLYLRNDNEIGEIIKFNKNLQILNFAEHSFIIDLCFYPFSQDFFNTLPSQLRYQAFALLLQEQRNCGYDTSEVVALLAEQHRLGLCQHEMQLLLAEQYLHNGWFSQAEAILLPIHDAYLMKAQVSLSPYLLALQGWSAFLQNNINQALAFFDQHKIAKNKIARRKRQYVAGMPGIFYLFTLLKLGQEDNSKYLLLAIEQQSNYVADNNNPEDEGFSYRTLVSMAKILNGNGKTLTRVVTTYNYASTVFDFRLNLLISSLGNIWQRSKLDDSYLNALQKDFQLWKTANQLYFAQIAAQIILHEDVNNAHFCLDETLRMHYQTYIEQQPGLINVLDLIRQKEVWLQALDKLISLDSNNLFASQSATNNDNDSRLVWLVNLERENQIEPREQRKNKSGWTKGRAIALQRLKETPEEFNFLSDADKNICKAIKVYQSYGWHNSQTYDLSGYIALKSCIGHPFLFTANERRSAIDIVENAPELLIEESLGGYSLSMPNIPEFIDFDETFYTFNLESGSRYGLTLYSEKHLEIVKIVGTSGLEIPKKAKEKVIESIKAIAPFLNVQSNMAGIENVDTGIEQVDADNTLYIHIEPAGEGLQLECLVKPLGETGPSLIPGMGNAMIATSIDSKRLGTNRSLAQEKSHFATLIDACPIFNYLSEHILVLDDFEDALLCLEQLEALQQQLKAQLTERSNEQTDRVDSESVTDAPFNIVLQWPKGKAIKVSKTLSTEQLSLKVSKSKDWFELDGDVEIDDGQVLTMKKLIGLVGNAKGRFIELSNDHFIALTDDLKKRLRLLEQASFNGKFNALSAPIIDEAITGMQVKSSKAWQQQMLKLKQSFDLTVQIPTTLQAQLRDYQQEGFDWASRLAHWGAGACLADDMGLGKTLQSLAVILARATQGPTLVLAPTSVLFNWQDEARRFAPTLKVKVLGLYNNDERLAILENAQAFDLIICSYGLLQTLGEHLTKVSWHTIIADEAQALKNPNTKRSKMANKLDANFKMITTGTPIENNLSELWSLFQFINPGLLGSLKQFNERYVKTIENSSAKEPYNEKSKAMKPIDSVHHNDPNQSLRHIISPFMLRRLKTDVLTELPSRTEINIHVELSADESALYEAIRQKAVENLITSDDKPGQQRIKVLAEIMRLRRACCHPSLVFPESDISSSKLAAFDTLVDELQQGSHKALVFSQFVGHLSILKQHLEEKGVAFQYLDGSTPLAKRKKAVVDFQAGIGDLFLISLKAGGSGLNLTAADYVIHMDPWWNPAVEDQASDRAHRIGQKRPVTIYRLISQNTIEDKIVALHQQKRDLANSLLTGTDNAKSISLDDMMNLLKPQD